MTTDDATRREVNGFEYWLPLALLANHWATINNRPIDSPVELADSFLGMCREKCPDGGVNAHVQMALDLNPAARLAFAKAWDMAVGVTS